MTTSRDQATTGAAAPVKAPENREWVDFAKGIAIALVVLYHSSLFLTDLDLAGSTKRVRDFLNFFPMPIFFFVAGLTGARMLTWTFRDLWRRRLQALVYLYFLWSFIRVAFYLLVPSMRGGTETGPTDPLNILLLPVWPTSSYWFIWAMVVFTVLAWLLRKVPTWLKVGFAVLLAVGSTTVSMIDLPPLVVAGSPYLDANNVGWDRVMQNFAFFLVAILIAKPTYRFAARAKIWHVLLYCLGYTAIVLGLNYVGLRYVPGAILGASILAVMIGITASVYLTRVRFLRVFTTLGQQSFQIYLLHLFPIALVVAGLSLLGENTFLHQNAVATALPFILCVLMLWVSLLLFRLLRRFAWLWVSPFGTNRSKKKAKKAEARTPVAAAPSSVGTSSAADESPRTESSAAAGTTPAEPTPPREESAPTVESAPTPETTVVEVGPDAHGPIRVASLPDEERRDDPLLEATVLETAVPEATVPETTAPEATVPETTAPKASVRDDGGVPQPPRSERVGGRHRSDGPPTRRPRVGPPADGDSPPTA